MIVAPGSTSQSVDVQILDDTGLAVTGLVAATFPATSWSLGGNTAATSITLSDLALITTAYSSGGVKERSGGYYRLDLPNAALASAGDVTLIADATGKHLFHAPITVVTIGTSTVTQAQITGGAYALQTDGSGYIKGSTGTGTGQWKLSSGVIDGNIVLVLGSTPTTQAFPTNFSSFSVDGSGRVDVGKQLGNAVTLDANNALNVSTKYIGGTLQTARDLGASVLLSPGTGTGQLSLSSGAVTVGTNNDKTGYTASTVSDKTGYALTSAYDPAKTASQAGDAMALTAGERTTLTASIWNALTSGITTAGSVGKRLLDFVTTLVYSVAPTAAAIDTQLSNVHGSGAWGGGSSGGGTVTFAQAAAAIGSAVPSAGAIGVLRGDTLSTQITSLGVLTGYTSLWVTAKASPSDADTSAQMQIKTTTGLTYIAGGVAGTASDGSITVDNAVTGAITVLLKPASSSLLAPGNYIYDVQMLNAGVISTLATGDFRVTGDVTRAVS